MTTHHASGVTPNDAASLAKCKSAAHTIRTLTYTTTEAAERLGITHNAVANLCQRGVLATIRIGKAHRPLRSAVEDRAAR